jgi:hypothetical protein
MNSIRHFFLSALILGLVLPSAFSQYTLTVEASEPVMAPGTKYRIFVDMVNPTDRMSAVFGNNQAPLEMSTPDGAFNSAFNSSWSASGVNPAFLSFFPDMADDTYATIGLDGPAASSGIPNAADPSLVQDSGQEISPYLLTNGSTLMLANTLTGSSYYVLNTAANGLPDANNRVLVMQVTTTGEICGTINYQVFPLGVGADQVQLSASFCGTGTFDGSELAEVDGCVDVNACNYNPEATNDDASCEYESCLALGCTDATACNYDSEADLEDGTCEFTSCAGCTVAQACNYDPTATINDGSCEFVSCLALGCTDMNACNYDPEAMYEDGTCEYATLPYDCNGECVNDADADGICDELESYGCTDMGACNYDASATDDDGSCFFSGAGLDCDGNCINDSDGDGVCDESEVGGCNDVNACNYDSVATDNNGSCDYCSCFDAGTDGYGLDVEVVAVHTSGALAGKTTYRVYITTPNDDDFLSAMFGDDADPLNIVSTTDFYQHIYGSALGSDMIPDIFSAFPELEYDSWVTIGLDSGPGAGQMSPQIIESTEFSWVSQFESGGNLDIDDSIGGAWFMLDPTSASNANPDVDQRILIAQLTTDGIPSGVVQAQMFNHGLQSDVSKITLSFNGTSGTSSSSCGCTDPVACNYDENATEDDGSCVFPDMYYSCDGNCLTDSDGDSICDELEIAGCTDMMACNYNADATDSDTSCEYAEMYYDCDGNCLADADNDGVCDSLEVEGCTDAVACNYNVDATDNDGSCEYAEIYYDCDGNCLADADGDGVCDALEVTGCTDVTACNYESLATDNDGSCEYAEMYYDCDGGCINDSDMDGICDELEVAGCTDMAACNYNADATDEDGSCWYAEMYYDCDGYCLNDSDMDGVCDELEVAGCTDMSACNYNTDATDEDGSCYYAEMYYDCDGNCLADADMDGVCDELEAEGCTDMDACNYNAAATDDDGSCDYDSCAGCTDEYANNYSPYATIDDGSCCYLVISVEIVEPLCFGGEGTIQATATGGIGDVMFKIGVETNTTGLFTTSVIGSFNILAWDENNCYVGVDSLTMNAPDELTITASATDATAATLGEGTATAEGGTGDYEIVWADTDGNEVAPEALADGTYVVTVTDENGCTASVEVIVLLDGVIDIDPLAFGMYPNPTNGNVTLQLPGTFDDVTVKVIDGVGRVVYTTQINVVQGSTTMNLSNLASGTYSIMLSNKEGASVRRLSIMR